MVSFGAQLAQKSYIASPHKALDLRMFQVAGSPDKGFCTGVIAVRVHH